MMDRPTSEADVRGRLIDPILRRLGWEDTTDPECDRFSREIGEQAEGCERRLKADYFLYLKGRSGCIAILEAKANQAQTQIRKGLSQALEYVTRIRKQGGECRIALASDGLVVQSAWHTGEELSINNETVRELPPPNLVRRFLIRDSPNLTRGDIPASSRELIGIFKSASKALQAEGLVNLDAFVEFSQILFLKLLSEESVATRSTSNAELWKHVREASGSEMLRQLHLAQDRLMAAFPGLCTRSVIRDPRSLRRILDSIDRYSIGDVNCDFKGEAYEHFLREYIKGKNPLGQHFTPRHIVQAMTVLLDPQLGETVYDPFCGTGGMLIQAFKSIRRTQPSAAADRVLRSETIFGAEITKAAMTAKMNMVLIGDGNSGVEQADSLSSAQRDKHRGRHDVIITNIPFRIDNEIASIRHCLESINPKRRGGRFAIIVPERVLDSTSQEYVALRRTLVEEWELRRVISLPRTVFRGITAAKTAVLYGVQRTTHLRRQETVPFVEVQHDGLTPDSRRDRMLGANDLDRLLEQRYDDESCLLLTVDASNGWRLKPPQAPFQWETSHEVVPLSGITTRRIENITIKPDQQVKEPGFMMDGKLRVLRCREERPGFNVRIRARMRVRRGDLVFSRLHTQDGLFAYAEDDFEATRSTFVVLIVDDRVDRDYLLSVLETVVPTLAVVDTTGREQYSPGEILSLPIPLLPSSVQRRIGDARRSAVQRYKQACAALAGIRGSCAAMIRGE